MSAPYYDLPSKLEAAAVALVNTLSLSGGSYSVAVLTGLTAGEYSAPAVICSCQQINALHFDLGIFTARLEVHIVHESPDTAISVHRSTVAKVGDAFMDSAIAATLSAAVADFHVYLVKAVGIRQEPEDKIMRTIFEFDVLCCASDIS